MDAKEHHSPGAGVLGRCVPLTVSLGVGAVVGAVALGWQAATLEFGFIRGRDLAFALLVYCGLGLLAGAVLYTLASLIRTPSRPRVPIIAVLVVVAAFAFTRWNRRPPCDVLLIMSDATRADHLSVYGYERETTPNLASFAPDCVIWEQMFAVGSSTIVAAPTVLTGLHPTQHGLTDYSQVLPDSARTLAQRLKDIGYATYSHATNPHLDRRQGFDRGFDVFNERTGWKVDAEQVLGGFTFWYASLPASQPAFAFLFTIDPHAPYTPPEAYQGLFDPGWQGLPVVAPQMVSRGGAPDPDMLRNLVAQYDAELRYFDDCLGKLLHGLREMDRLDDLLMIVTADHGEEFFEHGNAGHNRALFDESIRVPFIVHFPSPVKFPRIGPRGIRVSRPVSQVDILPTILDYLRQPRDARLSSPGLMETLEAPAGRSSDWVLCEQLMTGAGTFKLYAIRTPEWKFIRTLVYDSGPGLPDALYRLSADPGERENVIARFPAQAARLSARVDSVLDVLRLSAPDSLATAPLDDRTREELRSLGYIK